LPRDRLDLYDCLCCKPLLLWRCQLFIHMPACSLDPLLLCPVASLSFTHDEGWLALRNQPLQCHVGAPPTPPLPCLPSDCVCFPSGPAAGVIWSLVCMCEELWSPFCVAGHVCRCCVEYVPSTERMLLETWPALVNDLCLC
jgi:hypothetical protein